MRQLIAFPCAGETLVGTLDAVSGTTGLLIVSGGNEIRIGAHRGMALLGARLAAAGTPVFRFDRRGIGDSSGENKGYAASAPDIAAAVRAFREAVPHLTAIVGFGNCDAATALALFGHDAGVDRLILANPWVVESDDDLPPAAAIRAHYAERLRDPRAWLRALKGGVSVGKLISGLKKVSEKSSQVENALADCVFAALSPATTVILATGDATAIAFADAARTRGWTGATVEIDTGSHSFARKPDGEALYQAIASAIFDDRSC
ncbi:hydrolase 1, exosortase A system-associated [Hephaestia sp. GCM10023244]|uniref:hydrolase 1, exosortase A system-associated n=1 Tax=unclassified Hephaestia TaxID=2631281 RepID=UPI0020776EDF|nr:hydrolase 1, exosortase A system-associated [Hephaestia sp. MAHUQ-44]MCM8732154.1 hydrolase 1, exosortase A system-associated [Hephaestia sp. MAHUQ-44]